MKTNLIFLEPYLDAKIWGGNNLLKFNYNLTSDKIGEALIVSALPKMSSLIINKEYEKMPLNYFYENNRDFFNNYQGEYPILTKIIDANNDLSVQVHPNDEYAKLKHNKLGKTECWYILDAKPNASIIYGLKIKDPSRIKEAIEKNDWVNILNEINVEKDDVIYVESGTVHAIKAGLLIYEIQQSSDITYRLYDYNRLDELGNLRPLNIEDSLKVIKYDTKILKKNEKYLVDSKYFKLKKLIINGQYKLNISEAQWLEITVISGIGFVDDIKIKKGSVFLVKHHHQPLLKGKITLLIGYVV